MANSFTGLATTFNLPNYTGELFQLNQNTTTFLNLIGGLNGANMPVVQSTEFSMGQGWKLNEAEQPDISETESANAPEATHYTRANETNVVQIFQKAVNITYSKMGDANAIAGINIQGEIQPVRNEKDFQIQANLAQIAKNINFTFLHGVYQKPTDANTAARARGVLTAIETNVVENSEAAQLDKKMLNQLFRMFANNGADFNNAAILADAYNIQAISELYSVAPADRNIGGTAIKQIVTDFGNVMVIFEPTLNGTLGLFDLNKITPVLRNIVGKGVGVFYEDLAKVGASERGMLYGEIGIDYTSEAFHGKITNLVTE